MEDQRLHRLFKAGWILFAISIAAFGVENLVLASQGDAYTRIIPWLPAHRYLAYLVGAAFLAAGICIMVRWRTKSAAIFLSTLFLIFEICMQIPRAAVAPMDLGLRTLVFEILTLCASALMLAGLLPAEIPIFESWPRADALMIQLGRFFFAVSAIVFGITHFIIPAFIASLIPPWIPGPGMFWAYFTGTAFVAAGISIALNWIGRWAAAMLGLMFLLWFLLLHVPRILSYPRSHDPAEWSSAFIALGICGGSWIAITALSAKPSLKAPGD
jgi:uncharacterized membrane protein